MKLRSYFHKSTIIPSMFVLTLIVMDTSCQKQGATQVEEKQAPILGSAPFYSGTIRFTQLPTPTNPNHDFVVDFTVTFRPDSNGNWPKIEYDPPILNAQRINTARVHWGVAACYSDSILNGRVFPQKVLFGTTSHYILDTLIHLDGEVTRSYQITIPSSAFSPYGQTSDMGDLHLILNIYIGGAKLTENPSLNDILYSPDYLSTEHIEYTLTTSRIFYVSEGSPQKPSFTIVQ